MPSGVFGVTGTPVYEPAGGFVYVAATDKLWALDARTGKVRPGWPVTLPVDDLHEHVWGALTLGNGHVYLGTASYCDRRPYRGRVLAVSTGSGAVDHAWVTVSTPDGTPGGGGIWGWGGVAIAVDGHVWVATSNANLATTDNQNIVHAQTVDELTANLGLIASGPSTGMPAKGDLGFGSTPMVFKPARCSSLVAAEGKDGALYLWRRAALAAGPSQRLVLAHSGTLYGSPAWDPKTQRLFLTTTQGEGAVPAGLDALALSRDCRLRLVWTRPLAGNSTASRQWSTTRSSWPRAAASCASTQRARARSSRNARCGPRLRGAHRRGPRRRRRDLGQQPHRVPPARGLRGRGHVPRGTLLRGGCHLLCEASSVSLQGGSSPLPHRSTACRFSI